MTRSAPWRVALPFAVLGAGAAGLMVQPGPHDAELLVLLRFMAVIKGAMAVSAASLLVLRFGAPVGRTTATGYVLAAAAMAGGSGMIWQLGHVGAGALLVHGGLLALMALAWRDRAGWDRAARAIPASLRFGRNARPGARAAPGDTPLPQARSPSIRADHGGSPAGPALS